MSVHSFKAQLSNGEEVGLDTFRGNVMLIVNTASKCGLTPQYEGMEKLYEKYKEKGIYSVRLSLQSIWRTRAGNR